MVSGDDLVQHRQGVLLAARSSGAGPAIGPERDAEEG